MSNPNDHNISMVEILGKKKKKVSLRWRGDQKMRYLALGFAVVGGPLKHLN